MRGCERCGELFEHFTSLGFTPDIAESTVNTRLDRDSGVYLIEVKKIGRQVERDHTLITDTLGGRVPSNMVEWITKRDADPIIDYQTLHDCTVLYIGKTDKRGMKDRFRTLFLGGHTNLISIWILLQHDWELEFWYRKLDKDKVAPEEKRLIAEYRMLHSNRRPCLNRIG